MRLIIGFKIYYWHELDGGDKVLKEFHELPSIYISQPAVCDVIKKYMAENYDGDEYYINELTVLPYLAWQ